MAPDAEILILHDSETGNSWVSTVADGLKISVKKIAGVNLDVTFHNFSDSINFKNSGIIIVVINEKVIAGKELQKFVEISESIESKKPLFIVFQEPAKVEKLPESFKNKPAYNFFDINAITNNVRLYSINEDEEINKLFWAKILDLAFDLTSLLKKKKTSKTNQKAIYLAETTPDQFENRDLIRSELIQRGFIVYPDHILTGALEKLNAEINNYMEECYMSVHILGNQYGELIPGSEYSLIELQYRNAAKRWKETSTNPKTNIFQRLIWLKPGLRPSDERHKWFLGSLRIEEKDSSTEIMQTPIEELKSTLRSKISIRNEDETFKSITNNSGIYLIHEKKHSEQADNLKRYLAGKGLGILTIDYTKDSSQLLSQHYEYLKKSSSALICDFEGNVLWIRSKIKDLLKSPGLGRTGQFVAKALFTSIRNLNNITATDSLLLLDGSKDIAEAMEPFIKKINANG